jgi:hypothetical protein
MQISQDTINFLTRVIRVAKILKIENVVLDSECVRGNFQEEGSMIIHRDNLPTFEFNSLGISRIGTLDVRLNLLGADYTITADEKEKTATEKVITKLIMTNDKTEVEFKCADPATMPKAPKKLLDPIFFTFKINEDSVALLSKAQSAVRGETISLVGSKKSGVVGKISDTDGDMLNHVIATELTVTPESDKEKFYFSYKNKIILPLLKEAVGKDELVIKVTKRGMLNINVLGINVYITAEI